MHPPCPACSSRTQQRPYKLNTRVFFRLILGAEERNKDLLFFCLPLQEILVLNQENN